MSENKEAKIIKANKILQSKAGIGNVDKLAVERAEEAIDKDDTEFAPLALTYLASLKNAIDRARRGESDLETAVQEMTAPVMQIKANATMFKFNLIGNLANIMLGFLEGIKRIDPAVIEIVDAHHKTLKAIVVKNMTGDGGEYGKQLQAELRDACKRYFEKNRK